MGSAVTKFLLSLAKLLLNRFLPTRRPEPKIPPHPLPRDLLHIDDQIDRATSFKVVRFIPDDGSERERALRDLATPEVTSPRAIVPTQMRPPPRKPRPQ